MKLLKPIKAIKMRKMMRRVPSEKRGRCSDVKIRTGNENNRRTSVCCLSSVVNGLLISCATVVFSSGDKFDIGISCCASWFVIGVSMLTCVLDVIIYVVFVWRPWSSGEERKHFSLVLPFPLSRMFRRHLETADWHEDLEYIRIDQMVQIKPREKRRLMTVSKHLQTVTEWWTQFD